MSIGKFQKKISVTPVLDFSLASINFKIKKKLKKKVGKSVAVTSRPVGRTEYRAPVGGRKCPAASFWNGEERYPPS